MKRVGWKTRVGFYLAAIGSAFGLGNLWRFPFVVGENGGGAFVLLYIFLALVIGLPLLAGELMLGKAKRQSVMLATSKMGFGPRKHSFRWVGRMSVILSLVVLSYYAVISGWVLHFLMQFLIESLSGFGLQSQIALESLLSNGFLQMALASVHLLLAIVIVMKGVQEGLEKWVGGLMPAFALLMVVLVAKTLSLPSAPEALRFLFYPDFSKLSMNSLLSAIGHVCFTLSVGFGSMVTFGSYLSDEEHVPTAAFRITLIDTLLSLVAGLVIFPVALSAGHIQLQDPGLLFESLPRFLLSLPGGAWFGVMFFLCLYLASLSASIGLLEVIVSNTMDSNKVPRTKAAWLAGLIALFLAAIPAFSGTLIADDPSQEMRFLGNLDFALINIGLPLIAAALAVAITFGLSDQEKEAQFVDAETVESRALFPHWTAIMKWGVPGVVGLAVLLQFLSWVF